MVSRQAVAHALMLFERANMIPARQGGVDAWHMALRTAIDDRPGRKLKPINATDEELLAAANTIAGSPDLVGRRVTPGLLAQAVLRGREDTSADRQQRVRDFKARYGACYPDDPRLADHPKRWLAWIDAFYGAVGSGAGKDAASAAAYAAVGLTPPQALSKAPSGPRKRLTGRASTGRAGGPPTSLRDVFEGLNDNTEETKQ